MNKRIQSTRKYLRRRFLGVIFATLGFALLPLVLLMLVQGIFGGGEPVKLEASRRLKASYYDIDVSDIEEAGGSAMAVDKDLNVIPLAGKAITDKTAFTTAEWTQYLKTMGESSKYRYDAAYMEGEQGYWLVLRIPRAVTFDLTYDSNPEAKGYGSTKAMFLIILSVYVIALIIFVVVYSKRAARRVTDSVEAVSREAKRLEDGEFDIRVSAGETEELDGLNRAMVHLAGELKEKQELRKAEEEKRMLLVSELSHDLKTPLASVQGYSEMLLEGVEDESKRRDYLQMIYDNSVRSNEMLQALFTYSKLGSAGYSPNMEVTDICEYTRQVIAEYIPKFEDRGVGYSLSIPDEEINVNLSRELFRRIYDNLFENSMKYNPLGTEISVDIRHDGSEAEIRISDNGVGIPNEYRDKIFTPFYRGNADKSTGSGLGLAIVKRIAELHGAEIAVDHDVTQGCGYIIKNLRKI